MGESLLATKLYAPPSRAKAVRRPGLLARLNDGFMVGDDWSRRLTLFSAPPGFGKTSLACEWLSALPAGLAWLSLDAADRDPPRFLSYLISALQSAEPGIGAWVLAALQAMQAPSLPSLCLLLANDLAACGKRLVLVLDDYHSVTSPSIDAILALLVDSLPPKVHIVVLTREDPDLPLARYRGKGQLLELRAEDLRFSAEETRQFFRRVMDIDLADPEIDALASRTEGWAAGLQFAALALKGSEAGRTRSGFIASFTGSHRFVLDYLVEEVLKQRSAAILRFLMASACLDRFCGALCDAVLGAPPGTGRQTLESLEKANLFLVPLDGEGGWYRYHHLFADLLRDRMASCPPQGCPEPSIVHGRASAWFEGKGLVVEAFRHAAASGDHGRAEALAVDRRMPTHSREGLVEVLGWLDGLPDAVKDGRPSLWVKSATFSLLLGQTAGIVRKLEAAEHALRGEEGSEAALFGQIEMAKATLAMSQYRIEDIKVHALRALTLLPEGASMARIAASYNLGVAQQSLGEAAEAFATYTQVLAESRACGVAFFEGLASIGLGELEEDDGRLFIAEGSYRHAAELAGDHPPPSSCEAYLGLARIHYQWNRLDEAERYAKQALDVASLYDSSIDRFVPCELFLSRVDMARGDLGAAGSRLAATEESARRRGFERRLADIISLRAFLALRLGRLPDVHDLHQLGRVRVLLAQGLPQDAAGALLDWKAGGASSGEEGLQALLLEALIKEKSGDHGSAKALVEKVLAATEAGGHLRLFADEGPAMRDLVLGIHEEGRLSHRTAAIIPTFSDQPRPGKADGSVFEPAATPQKLLSPREVEVLALVARGLANQEIADRLYLSLQTVKVHLRNILAKLEASNRTSAVAKARDFGILS